MAIQDEGWETRLLGYRVSGFAPGDVRRKARQSDDFDLKQVAIEHANRLEGLGWCDVQMHTRTAEHGEEFLDPVQWRPIGAPA